jgi:transposase InsO family protein
MISPKCNILPCYEAVAQMVILGKKQALTYFGKEPDSVKQCPKCITLSPVTHLRVNPQGLMPNHIWQMDVTHYAEPGKLKYIHVCIDTCSGFPFASLHTGEASKNVTDHCLQAFNAMGLPKVIQADNRTSYYRKNFTSFCKEFGIKHKTEIPYNPMRQGIVECAYLTLKNWLYNLVLYIFKIVMV